MSSSIRTLALLVVAALVVVALGVVVAPASAQDAADGGENATETNSTNETEDAADEAEEDDTETIRTGGNGIVDNIKYALGIGSGGETEVGVIDYEERDDIERTGMMDWGPTQLLDIKYDFRTETAVFVFYSDEGEDEVAITETGEGRLDQTRVALDQGKGVYTVRAPIRVRSTSIITDEMGSTVATRRGDGDLFSENEEKGIGPIIPSPPPAPSMLLGAVAVAISTVAIGKKWRKKRRSKVTQL